MIVRNEKETDHRHVEELIRKAFYNLYVPGCTEHYLARVMRGHEDFIPELDLVLELDGRVIGSILYTKAKLSDAAGKEKEIDPLVFLPGKIRGERSVFRQHPFPAGKVLFQRVHGLRIDIRQPPYNALINGFYLHKHAASSLQKPPQAAPAVAHFLFNFYFRRRPPRLEAIYRFSSDCLLSDTDMNCLSLSSKVSSAGGAAG